MLTPVEIERYRRHLVLREVGAQGQQLLQAARVLVVGAGGLGSPVLLYLAAAGVGTIGIIDDDTVSLDNLQRQIVHQTADVGRPKVESAKDAIQRLNPHVVVETYEERLTAANALDIIGRYDIVADGSDNFANALSRQRRLLPCQEDARVRGCGSIRRVRQHVQAASQRRGRHSVSELSLPVPRSSAARNGCTCSEIGVLGAVVGVIGTLQATEVIKEITGAGESLAGRLLIYDALSARCESIKISWDSANPLSGEQPTIKDLSAHLAAAREAACAA